MRKNLKTFIIFIFLMTAISNCTQLEKTKETAIIKDTVMNYNRGIIEAAKTGDVKPLKDIASEDVVKRLYLWLAAWRDSDAYMDAELKDIKYKSLNISGQTAKVLTLEEWLYEYKNTKNEQIALPQAQVFYEMEYVLRKEENNKNNNWIITEVNIRSEKRGKGKG